MYESEKVDAKREYKFGKEVNEMERYLILLLGICVISILFTALVIKKRQKMSPQIMMFFVFAGLGIAAIAAMIALCIFIILFSNHT